MMPRNFLAPVMLALLVAGCGRSYSLAPVSGQVTLDNRPLANATVMFVPAAGAPGADPLPTSFGTTDEAGHYSLALQNEPKTSGAVVGNHKIIISVGAGGSSTDAKPTFHKNLPARYNRNSELQCEVPAGGRDDANFALKSG